MIGMGRRMVMLHDDDDNDVDDDDDDDDTVADTDDDTAIAQQQRSVDEGDETEVNQGKQQRTRPILYEEAIHLLQHRFHCDMDGCTNSSVDATCSTMGNDLGDMMVAPTTSTDSSFASQKDDHDFVLTTFPTRPRGPHSTHKWDGSNQDEPG
jgi:hypothetical protein